MTVAMPTRDWRLQLHWWIDLVRARGNSAGAITLRGWQVESNGIALGNGGHRDER